MWIYYVPLPKRLTKIERKALRRFREAVLDCGGGDLCWDWWIDKDGLLPGFERLLRRGYIQLSEPDESWEASAHLVGMLGTPIKAPHCPRF